MAAIKVGTAVAKPGKRTIGELVVGYYPDRAITAPVTIACGAKPGKTLWVQGCVHGPEVGGVVGILRFLEKLDLRKLSGTIVAVMLANPTAFRGYSRNTPIDTTNLNRVFPGSADGPHSAQTAHALMEAASATADVLLDLHSGGDRSLVPFYALYWDDGSPASREAGRLARAAGTRDIWAARDEWLGGAMFTILTQRGKPALIVECGGGAQVPDEHIASYVTAIRGIAQAIGILPGKPPRQKSYRLMREGLLVYSTSGGLFRPLVKPGAVVRKGQVLGEIIDLHGAVVERPRAPSKGFIASIRRRYMPVYSGDQIAECNTLVGN
jgi:hypothetical protein